MSPAPYDERNKNDFDDMTQRIEDALKMIEDDETIPATEAKLCKLAKCNRGTLRNREWPLDRLKEIKKKRKEDKGGKRKRITRAHLIAVEVHIEDKNKLDAQLKNCRSEAAKWFHKFMDYEEENKRLKRANESLRIKHQRLQEQADEAERELHWLRSAAEKGEIDNVVVPFPRGAHGGKSADV